MTEPEKFVATWPVANMTEAVARLHFSTFEQMWLAGVAEAGARPHDVQFPCPMEYIPAAPPLQPVDLVRAAGWVLKGPGRIAWLN